MFVVTKIFRLLKSAVEGIKHLYLWPLIGLLSACSTLGSDKVENSHVDLEPAEVMVEAAPEIPTAPAAQGEGLTADLLYDLLLSNLALQQGEMALASEALIRAARTTGDPAIIESAVRMAVHNKNYAEAVELGQRWITLSPKDYQAGIITALAAVMNQQPDIADNILSAMMARADGKIGLRFGQLGEMFLQFAEGPGAQDVLLRLANEYPESAEAWLVLAGMAQKNKDFPAMNSALDRLLVLEPGSEKAAGYKLLALSEDPVAQAKFAKSFLQELPDASDFQLQYIRLLLRLENEPVAVEQLLDLLKHDAKNSQALNLLALLYQAREDYENAVKYFALKIKVSPDDDRSRLYLAHALQELERYDEAKASLSKVRDTEQRFAADRQMSLLIEQADGVESALVYLQALSGENEAQTSQLIIDHELMLQRAGRTAEAYALINDALIDDSDNDTLRYHRALILVERDDIQGHEADMRILLSHEPENAHYNNTLGYSLLVMTDRLDEASVLINKAHELQTKDAYILDSKGWLEYKLGNLDAAIAYLLKAYSLDQDAEIAAHIGEVYWIQGNQEKAREFWREGNKIDASNQSLQDTRARFLN